MTRPLKLVISGPVGAGKTTFVQTLSETEVIATEAVPSEDIGKPSTTVAFDYGTLRLEDQELHLYGTPGQDRFDFMWDVLAQDALGLVMLVGGHKPRDFPAARGILEYITARHQLPFVLAVTRQDQPGVWRPEDLALYVQLPPHQVIGIDATNRASAATALVRLLEHLPARHDQDVTLLT
ncbi:GTP-binding protein [Deinococcus pimensis]|uniref:GTP-binding protein n=1 Tax=Deinococcus pimensis TaxID=309888 RepID=UPI0004B0F2B8|nr:ATP/GTP-binding protein [Deinococcus pimensis]